jgi:hypothetical protein
MEPEAPQVVQIAHLVGNDALRRDELSHATQHVCILTFGSSIIPKLAYATTMRRLKVVVRGSVA